MKRVKSIIAALATLLGSIQAQAQDLKAVMVDSNGVVAKPTNFWSQAPSLGGGASWLNLLRDVQILTNGWTLLTNSSTVSANTGQIVISSTTTNSGDFGVAYYNGALLANINTDSSTSLRANSGWIFTGSISGFRTNTIKRVLVRGISATNVFDDVGILDCGGIGVELRQLAAGTNQLRLLVFASDGLHVTGWSNAPTPRDRSSVWIYATATNSEVYWGNEFGTGFTNAPVASIAKSPATATNNGPANIGISFTLVNTNVVGSSDFFSILNIYETYNLKPQ
jgi:hypothetical protein